MAHYYPKRGHIALKSNALNPTSTSYEGQQLILNHMKSHYSRISKAKAAVDTSPPRSLKKHIRAQDRKQREFARKNSDAQSEGRITPRRAQSASVENLSNDGLWTSSRPNSIQGYYRDYRTSTPRDRSTPEPSSSSVPRDITSAFLKSSKDQPRQYGLRQDPNECSSRVTPYSSPIGLPGPLVSQSRWKSSQLRKSVMQSSYNYDIDARDSRIPVLNDKPRECLQTTDTYSQKAFEESVGPTPNTVEDRSDSRMSTGLHSHALDSSYSSLRSPSSAYAQRKKEMKTKMWEEEQKYLQFISDVTSDVLGRGIFSNRVLNKVFECHIDKRKDDLEEGRMRDMIDQLKLDLDIQ